MELYGQWPWLAAALCLLLIVGLLYRKRRQQGDHYGAMSKLDLVAEAEILLHYQRYAEAGKLLKVEIDKHPGNLDAKLLMLKVLAKQNMRIEFELLARDVYPQLIESNLLAWEKVAKRGRKLDPANPLYQPHAIEQHA